MTASVLLDRNGIRIDGRYRVLLCSSVHYFRIPRELWKDRLQRVKDAGYTCVDLYFPWNFHERAPGRWDFSAERDAAAFLDLVTEVGLYAVARPGPYICSEWDGGAIPAWILASGMRIREDSEPFLTEVRGWYERIVPLIAAREVGRGGSVILFQVDNELDFFDCPDPAAYIGSLASLARKLGITVPVFGCAGQGSAERATGFAPGVEVTFNLYPSAADPHFDQGCRLAAAALRSVDRPLLVTETNREHAVLRRELANGTKLLGAYNQVAGSNFGFTASINNLGKPSPLSFIASDYNFRSMVDAAGEYGPEAAEGRLLGALIETLGESLACATVEDEPPVAVTTDFPTNAGAPAVLRLRDGGYLVCVPNLSETCGTATVRGPGFELKVAVGPMRSPLIPLDVPIDRSGVSGRIVGSSAEILAIEEGRLVLYADGDAEVVLALGADAPVRVRSASAPTILTHGGKSLQVLFLTREQAAAGWPGHPWRPAGGRRPSSVTLSAARKAPFEPAWIPADATRDGAITMEARGLYRGFALYDLGEDAPRSLLLRGVADVVTAYDGGRRLDTRISAGQWQRYQGTTGAWRFWTESWGHSNFDDSRLPSMRLCSSKGIESVFEVVREESLAGQWRFRLMDQWLPKRLEYPDHPFDAALDPNQWNSTRSPLLALYRTDVTLAEGSQELALHLDGGRAEVALYVGGDLVGVMNPNDPWIGVPSSRISGGHARLELLCRKRDWAEPVGAPTLLHLRRLDPKVLSFGEEQLAGLRAATGARAELPLTLERDATCMVDVDLAGLEHRCGYAVFDGRDVKLTAVFDGRVVGRIFCHAENRPFVTGGDGMRCYLPGPWYDARDNHLVLLVEP
ncbi:MAG TPA: beta-galactosidase, partial [Spirochaetia bacterium]|nr:beta-galactosidase [Spirochaetia bacterium]